MVRQNLESDCSFLFCFVALNWLDMRLTRTRAFLEQDFDLLYRQIQCVSVSGAYNVIVVCFFFLQS